MSLIAVEAAITVADPSTRQALIDRSAPIQKATRDDEPGCLVYCFAADPCQDDLIQVYELWTDPENLAKHFDHPNYASMVQVLHNCGGFVSSENRLWAADDRGTVYGDDGTFRFDAVADAGA